MSTPFLTAFALGITTRLVQADQLVIAPGRFDDVVTYLAADLAQPKEGRSLISTVSAALIRCQHVVDLFADDQTIKQHVVDMGAAGG